MNRKEVINQLKELIEDRKSFMVGDYDEVYDKDVQALEHAIKELTAQEVPVQEQYVDNFNPKTGKKLYDVCPKCWVKGNIPYRCGFDKCPGYKLITQGN